MGRNRSRSRSYSPSVRRKRYNDPRDRHRSHRSPSPSGLLVRNISLHARPEDLRIPFERFGPIKDIYLPKDYYTGEPRGFGFVKFRYPEDAAEAKQCLNHTVIGGREIRIVFAEENRKTPQEMRRVSHVSGQSSHRRRSLSRSPRRRYRSCSHSPGRHESRGQRAKDDYYSPSRSRSVSRSASPHSERNHRSDRRSSRHSRSISRSLSPCGEPNNRSNYRSPSSRENCQSAQEEKDIGCNKSHSRKGGNSRSSSQSFYRSYSPR